MNKINQLFESRKDRKLLSLYFCAGCPTLEGTGDVIKAIYKACPSLVLVSDGIKDKVCWAYKRRNQFSSSIFIYYKEVMGIFSKRVKRIDEKTFERGHEIYHEIIRNPLKIFLIFPYIWYILVLVWYRLLKK